MRPYKKGFTISEFLIAIIIVVITITLSFQIFISLRYDYGAITSYLASYLKGREVIDRMSKDCRIAIRVLDSFSSYTTTDDSIVLKVPSIDNLGNIIDVDHEFDYIIYRIYQGDLWKIVIPGTASSRPPQNEVFKKSMESLFITSNGAALSQIPHKSSITNVTLRVSAIERFQGKDYRVTPGTSVKLMNYEWEFVR